ncbi:phosphate acyltransferase PlsX [Candidatus Pelagibacter sp.]|nr:phosphate acyltransferase PlsX [Candidatus Pelagibacter sp.]
MNNPIKIAVDAMGGEDSPNKIINGIKLHNSKSNQIFYNIFGDRDLIQPIINKVELSSDNYQIIHTKNYIKDEDSPLSAAKKGKDTSMWLSIESLKNNESDAIISAGNTGALFVIAKLNLKMIEKIDKPALSALWPNKNGMNIVLDLGANVECNEKNLFDFSVMGAALHKSLFEKEESKVALLNIGSEEIKGNNIIKNAYQMLTDHKNSIFKFEGYIEGNQIMDGNVNVIVTDGFTGNVALKTAEGTANFITSELKYALNSSLIGKISAFLNIKNLKKFKKKLDPRLYNGAILLGLDKPVIKSHGSTDEVGFANSLKVCEKIIKGNLIDKIKRNIS